MNKLLVVMFTFGLLVSGSTSVANAASVDQSSCEVRGMVSDLLEGAGNHGRAGGADVPEVGETEVTEMTRELLYMARTPPTSAALCCYYSYVACLNCVSNTCIRGGACYPAGGYVVCGYCY